MVFSVYCLVSFFLWRTRFFFYERLAPFIKTQRFFFLKKQHVLCYGLMKSDDLTIVHA